MEMWVHEIKQLRRNFDFANKIAKLNEPEYDSELGDFDNEFFSSTGKINITQIKSSLQKYETRKPTREAPPNWDAYNVELINLWKQNIDWIDGKDYRASKIGEHSLENHIEKLDNTISNRQTYRENNRDNDKNKGNYKFDEEQTLMRVKAN